MQAAFQYLCDQGFKADGEVNLLNANIGGQVNFNKATLANSNGRALNGDSLSVGQNMLCGNGFKAEGEINLRGAQVGGQLGFVQATLVNPGKLTLNLQQLQTPTLFLRDLTERPGDVRFERAKVGAIVDEPDSWPTSPHLDGFIYDSLYEDRRVPARQRLRWLSSSGSYLPQPYEQLAAVYRRAGRPEDTRKVLITKQWRRRSTLHPLGKLWNWLLYLTVGYGYRSWLAVGWLAAFVLAGSVLLTRAHEAPVAGSGKRQSGPAADV